MDTVRFSDLLFTFIVLAITFAILWMVNRVRNKSKGTPDIHSTDSNSTKATEAGDG